MSFWLQGQFGSFAAVPSNPGWSFESAFYHARAVASAGVSFARGGGFQAGMMSPSDFVMVTPTYAFATPVLGGQAAVGMTAVYGRNTTSVSATLTGPGGTSLSGSRSDYVLGFGDLYPAATLKWNQDVHNFMLYATAAVPVGVYDPTRLATMGLGHWATDAGAGYTYLNEQVGFEWSAVVGVTYNSINPYTQYRSGIDAHLDWAISPYLTERLHIGAVGYVYNQVTGDSGAKSRARRVQITRCRGRAADRVFLSRRGPRRIPQSQRLLRVRRQEPARRMDRLRHVFRRGSGAQAGRTEARKAGHVSALTAAVGRRAGLQPPRAIATPTSAAPTATIERPVAHGRNPA